MSSSSSQPESSGAASRRPKKCSLDENHCVNLADILMSFSAPISEEHAWALCYQCAKCFRNALKTDPSRCKNVMELSDVLIHRDGHVHSNTIFEGGGKEDYGEWTPALYIDNIVS
ncbi:unnamed protein product [Nezara viridula]|uniref:KIND domain-containing protein n=1 Tax=Nezara viridula TaxID=85310 RepID=A0A9P0ME12_NEZVI|nr:unnamed protein product [Nezara viridula]